MSAETETSINAAINDAAAVRDPLEELVEKAAADPGAPFEPDAIALLITTKKEKPAVFERLRLRLKDAEVRIGELDKLLNTKTGKAKKSSNQGQPLTINEPAPYETEVDGAALLNDIAKALSEHVILPDKAAEAVALWVAMTYGVGIFDCLPRLYIHSPERECGKTTLLSRISRLAWRSLPASSISSSSTFRVIEMAHPTLCLDESDTYFKENPELRGVINSGHTRETAFIIRNAGEEHEPRQFSTYTPIAIAGIGRIHDTTESRSIIIAMRRKKKGENVKKLRKREREPFATLARKIRRWVNDNGDRLAKCDPAIPEELGDRATDNWQPLLAIADTAGGEWPERARQAAIRLSTGSDAATTSFLIRLLTDIKTIFEAQKADRIPSKELADALANIEGHPWAEYGRQHKAINQHGLARLLAHFSIVPSSTRTSDKNLKGYKREQFEDTWDRYLPSVTAESSATPSQSAENQGVHDDPEPPQDDDGDGLESGADAWKTADCDGVTDEDAFYREIEA